MNTKTMRILSVLAGVSVLVLLLIGDLLAVLSDKDTGAVAFEYTADDVEISLSVSCSSSSGSSDSSNTGEASGENEENIATVAVEPGQSFPLQVSVESVGEKDSYLLLEFDVPVVSSSISGEVQDVDLFALEIDESGWFEVRNEVVGDVHTYVFGYGDQADTLETFYAGDEVSGVVENASFHDFSSAFEWTGRMEIKAYAIQTVGYETSTPSAVWSSVVSLNP
ncbi:MAG: hypothetical protein IJ153_04285 [Clostridia bacterium]|nr:hypothetical protein [Clostridia bacterium]